MSGGGEDAPPVQRAANGGEFLLSLLQRPNQHQSQTSLPPHSQLLSGAPALMTPPPRQQQQHQQQQQQQQRQQHQQQQESLSLDPAVASVGPSVPFTPTLWPSNNGHDFVSPPPWPHNLSPPAFPRGYLGFPRNPWPAPGSQFQGNHFPGNQQPVISDDLQRLGLSSNSTIHNLVQKKQPLEHKIQFGSFLNDNHSADGLLNVNSKPDVGIQGRNFNELHRNLQFDPAQANSNSRNFDFRERDRRGKGGNWGNRPPGSNYRSPESRTPPPGFSNKPRGGGNWERREVNHNHNVMKEKGNHSELSNRNALSNRESERLKSGDRSLELGLAEQLEQPGPPAGSNLHSVSASDIEESLLNLHAEIVEDGKDDDCEMDELGEDLVDSLLIGPESDEKKEKKKLNRHFREKESRSDGRGQRILSQRMRMLKRQLECRRDIETLNSPFLAIYESLIPLEEEKAKQKQLLTMLEKIVRKEWPEARLYLYGSCANSFGVSKSDIDVCLAIENTDIDKCEFLLKLADILQSDNLQNVQALTRARVPIVKLMDPATGISCDICINNILAVVNTKLLRDYGEIDVRLRQLAFLVKHWAKSRGVNETYQGTLSSYAYVLMCIHFLQLRRTAILPCLQGMDQTYSVTIDEVQCSYFDQVEKLRGFGSHNKETIAHLVWAFFNYWAYWHDYANDVISIRTGSIISKRDKDWTRRIGNDRHLICIEDPFEISHDLGRVVDKYTIRVLREEFERAANIMQYDPNPWVTLFEPYVPS